jgi:hypothetical protein
MFSIPVSNIIWLTSGEICGRELARAILVKPIIMDDNPVAVRGVDLIIR